MGDKFKMSRDVLDEIGEEIEDHKERSRERIDKLEN
jgi:hypothetical protein